MSRAESLTATRLSTEHTAEHRQRAELPARDALSCREMKDQTACKPGSVPPALASGEADGHSSGPAIAGRFSRPTRTLEGRRRRLPDPMRPGATSLFGLAPGGACHAVPVARSAVGSYPTLSPLPPPKPKGGLLSVALSLGSPPAGVTRRLVAVEPGLSSPSRKRRPRPPGRLVRAKGGRWSREGQGTRYLPPLRGRQALPQRNRRSGPSSVPFQKPYSRSTPSR